MIFGVIFATLLIAAAVVGVVLTARDRARYQGSTDRSGWVYFIGGAEGPVKIGMSSHEPTQQRLPELRTMSPVPLKIIHKFQVSDRFKIERAIHRELEEYRVRGEWYDRDATLYYLSELREEQDAQESNGGEDNEAAVFASDTG